MYLDHGVSDLQGIIPCLQVPEQSELGGISNLHPGAQAVTVRTIRQDEALERRGVHHGDDLHLRGADLDTPEAVADEPEAQPLDAAMDVEDLQDGAPGDDGVDVSVLRKDKAEAELPEVGEGDAAEAARVRELPDTDTEAGESGDVEERSGEGHVDRPWAVDEDEVLDAPDSEEAEPAP